MKKICSLIAFALLATTATYAQDMSAHSMKAEDNKPLASPKDISKGAHVAVTYYQPSKKGRVIFGGLVPYGEVWRTGANNATEITFNKDGMFGGKPVKKGTYSLFTIPNAKEWTVILNSQMGQWGSFKYDQYKDKDVLRTTVPVKNVASSVEKFTITVESDVLIMVWDKTEVRVPMKF